MNSELEALEGKIDQVIELVGQLRAENEALKTQISVVETERQQLRETMTAARERLEVLMDKLPEDV